MNVTFPEPSVPCITINTDASFSPQQKVGGYAFYIVCNSFRVKKSGPFKVNPRNSEQAEMMCMANALSYLLTMENLPRTGWIVINSDCKNSFFKIGHKSNVPVGRQIAKLLSQLRKKTALAPGKLPKHEFRHVKAHNGSPDSRSFVNEWCDQEAKKHMRLLASQAKQKSSPTSQEVRA